ncbi:hypothetical protein DQG23_38275 [Paenibacillus contaminans]|uniref:Uncharacterized protein n=1 Tax=Paenibacillus contaminans TaxID=450362 RepID=A0A329LQP6_9BACL|nr:hypothetical protein DQG23_38275 [Paenibacillus contaminans]
MMDDEREVMGVSVNNGKLHGALYAVTTAETLGSGSAYWRSRTRISKYRRVWSTAETGSKH